MNGFSEVCERYSGTSICFSSININSGSLMLFLALVFILFMFYVFHTTKMQLIRYLERGEVDNALRLLKLMDLFAKDD